MSTATKTELHVLCALTASRGEWVRDSTDYGWADAQERFNALDEARCSGLCPQVRFYAVRSVADPDWANAPARHVYFVAVTGKRGFADASDGTRTGAEKAASAGWALRVGGEQGKGGWFYDTNGAPVTQGLHSLARICQGRGWIVEANGRWYVATPDAS